MDATTAELAERLRATVRRLADDSDTSARWPSEPPPGTVLRFVRPIAERAYTYVALRIPAAANDGRHWYLTGTIRERRQMTWDELQRFIGPDGDCEVAVQWYTVPPVIRDETPVDPADWVAATFGPTNIDIDQIDPSDPIEFDD